MTDNNQQTANIQLDSYPYSVIIPRWIFASVEMGLATYFAYQFRFQLGFIFLIYGFVSAFVLLPLIRCVRCGYYGKRCNFGWGVMVSKLFSRAENSPYYSTYGYTILLWPLRIIPIGIGILKIIDGFLGGFYLVPQGLFGIYLAVIFLHRRFYRARACKRCRQRTVCPVYDIAAVKGNLEER